MNARRGRDGAGKGRVIERVVMKLWAVKGVSAREPTAVRRRFRCGGGWLVRAAVRFWSPERQVGERTLWRTCGVPSKVATKNLLVHCTHDPQQPRSEPRRSSATANFVR